jgi:hypothetical protein
MISERLTSVVRSSARAGVALAATLAWSLPAAVHAVPPGDGAFGAANVVPGDVTALVRVRGVRSLRSDGNLLPAQAALLRLAGSRVLSQAWDGLAGQLGLDASTFVDRLLGEDAIYAERTRDGRAEWAIVTRTDQAMQDLLVERLKPAASAGGRSVYGPQQVAASWRPPFLVLGPPTARDSSTTSSVASTRSSVTMRSRGPPTLRRSPRGIPRRSRSRSATPRRPEGCPHSRHARARARSGSATAAASTAFRSTWLPARPRTRGCSPRSRAIRSPCSS